LDNYKLTFSASELTDDDSIKSKLQEGENVAIVFKELPTEHLGFKVLDGDDTDNRYDDENGVIVGLKVKNTAGSELKGNRFIKA
jgi:hypothetical protein